MGAIPGEASDRLEHEVDLPSVPGEAVEYHSIQLIRDEFLMNIQKFANSIQRTMQQLEGELLFLSFWVEPDGLAFRGDLRVREPFCFNLRLFLFRFSLLHLGSP